LPLCSLRNYQVLPFIDFFHISNRLSNIEYYVTWVQFSENIVTMPMEFEAIPPRATNYEHFNDCRYLKRIFQVLTLSLNIAGGVRFFPFDN
jgi:hypothetical protein